MKASVRGTAFRRCGRSDLDWWQLDKSRWRHTLAGQTVTIYQHLDGRVSIRYGPHLVGRGKDGAVENQNQVSPRSLEIASGDSHFPTALDEESMCDARQSYLVSSRKVGASPESVEKPDEPATCSQLEAPWILPPKKCG